MTLAYQVEELLALRDSVSESAVSIDKFADEDVIKEHVLRPSASACLINAAPDNNSRLPVIAGLAANSAGKKPSPSPSVKRGKAERLLKEHGSPPGMRVTAGGRVVPSDLPPLGSSRYPQNNSRTYPASHISPINSMPSQQVTDPTKVLTNGTMIFNASGQPCFYVNNQLIPIQGVDFGIAAGSASNQNTVYSAVPSMADFAKQYSDTTTIASAPNVLVPFNHTLSHRGSAMNVVNGTQVCAAGTELQTLKQRHALMSKELKLLEQTEVLQSNHQNEEWREAIIKQKRNLIIEIDTLRRQIKATEGDAPAGNSQMTATNLQTSVGVAQIPLAQHYQQSLVSPMYPNGGLPATAMGIPSNNPYAPSLFLYPPYTGTQLLSSEASQFSSDGKVFGSTENPVMGRQLASTAATVSTGDPARSINRENTNQSPTGPGSAARRSHAIEIKPPREDTRKRVVQGSTLDPKSPTYEPSNKSALAKLEDSHVFRPPTPSPIPSPLQNDAVQARNPWLFDGKDGQEAAKGNRNNVVHHRTSISSVSTADFFPTNTHEHSSTRTAPTKAGANRDTEDIPEETQVGPSTPEKQWPVSPWNPVSRSGEKSKASNRSFQVSPLGGLTSWTQEFGHKAENSRPASIRGTSKGTSSERLAESLAEALQATGDGQEWSLISAKATDHLAATYQEGYQAGIIHKGLPDNIEVIRGYFEGLAAVLKDFQMTAPGGNQLRNAKSGSIASKASSFRGNLFGTSPNDSAVSLSFSARSREQATLSQENIRSAATNALLSAQHLPPPTHSPNGSIWSGGRGGVPLSYSQGNEIINAPGTRHQTPSMAANVRKQRQPDEHIDKSSFGNPVGLPVFRQVDINKTSQAIRAAADEPQMPPPGPLSGNYTANKLVGTPVSQQRYYPDQKEYKTGTCQGASSFGRAQDQRFSGYDGAMDDLAEMMQNNNITTPQEADSVEASCFKSSLAKGSKQKSSPTKTTESPRKSSDTSPAKNKLKQMVNKDKERRSKDAASMSPEEKRKWRNQWRNRFQKIKNAENEEIEQYKRENP